MKIHLLLCIAVYCIQMLQSIPLLPVPLFPFASEVFTAVKYLQQSFLQVTFVRGFHLHRSTNSCSYGLAQWLPSLRCFLLAVRCTICLCLSAMFTWQNNIYFCSFSVPVHLHLELKLKIWWMHLVWVPRFCLVDVSGLKLDNLRYFYLKSLFQLTVILLSQSQSFIFRLIWANWSVLKSLGCYAVIASAVWGAMSSLWSKH